MFPKRDFFFAVRGLLFKISIRGGSAGWAEPKAKCIKAHLDVLARMQDPILDAVPLALAKQRSLASTGPSH